jgi:hypothetical protein
MKSTTLKSSALSTQPPPPPATTVKKTVARPKWQIGGPKNESFGELPLGGMKRPREKKIENTRNCFKKYLFLTKEKKEKMMKNKV